MASRNEILLRKDLGDGVTVLTMNRPHAYNSLSSELLAALQAAFDDIGEDATARCVVIEGAGAGFCSGHYLNEFRALTTSEQRRSLLEQCSRLMLSIVDCPKPVIAKVHGVASAAGCQLVASADLAFAASDARFATPGVNIGLFCHTPMVPLSRNISAKHAMEMLLVGDLVDAETALRFGLINAHVPRQDLQAKVLETATKIASKSSHVLKLGKQAFYRQLGMDLAGAYAHAVEAMVENMLAEDAEEGIAAFIEKRQPSWKDA